MPDGFGVRELCSRFSSWRSVRHIQESLRKKIKALASIRRGGEKSGAKPPHSKRMPFSRTGGTGFAGALRRGWLGDPRAGVDAETVSAAQKAAGKDAASAGRQRRRTARATSGHGNGRRAEGNRRRRQRADVLRIGAPIKRLIAELHVQIARRAHEINARGAERGRRIRLRKVK